MLRMYRRFYGKVGRRGITQADKSSLLSKMRHIKIKGIAMPLGQRVSRGLFQGKGYCIF